MAVLKVLRDSFLGAVGRSLARSDTQDAARNALGFDARVVTLLGEDETVVAAATAAIPDALTAYLTGVLDLVTATIDADDDGVIFGVRDAFLRAGFTINDDGTVEIPLPVLADVPIDTAASPNGYIKGSRKSGQVAEDVIDESGCVPDWVLARWKDRGVYGLQYEDWIVLCAGQSNMSGSVATPPVGLYDTDPRLVRYDPTTGALVPLSTTDGALWSTIPRALAEKAPPNVRIIAVQVGAGSTGFTTTSIVPAPAGYVNGSGLNGTWDRTLVSDPLNLYVKMVADYTAAKALSPSAKTAGFFWSQGEGDYGQMNQAQYAAALDDMIGAFRTVVGNAILPVSISSMVPEYVAGDAAKQGVENALTDTPRRLFAAAYVYGPENAGRSDQSPALIHYATNVNGQRARMLVAGLERARWNYATAVALPPQNLRLTRSGTVLTAKWDAPQTRSTLFTVEFTVNGGGLWTAMTKPAGVIGLSATATISTSDVVQVRAKSTNADYTGFTDSAYTYQSI